MLIISFCIEITGGWFTRVAGLPMNYVKGRLSLLSDKTS